jgi:nitrite reductase/ring-hydroxylating ferredoxin subunit
MAILSWPYTQDSCRWAGLDKIAMTADIGRQDHADRRADSPRGRGSMADAKRAKVADVGELADGQAMVVDVAGRTIALFNVGGTFYAMDNACAHRGGPLGEGDLEGRLVICPWHAWRWDVTTGRNANNPAVTMTCYPVRVEPGGIFLELP